MKKIIKISLIFLLITACQSAKDAFTLKKRNSADEFLVEKKSPLVLPPQYGELPLPENKEIKNDDEEDEEIKILVSNSEKNSQVEVEKNSKPSSIENSILEKIK